MSNPPFIFWVYLIFFVSTEVDFFCFFLTRSFSMADFGDDGSIAGGRVKSAVFFLGLFGFFCPHVGRFLYFFNQIILR